MFVFAFVTHQSTHVYIPYCSCRIYFERQPRNNAMYLSNNESWQPFSARLLLRSLIRVLAGHSIGSQGTIVSASGQQIRSDCADARIRRQI